MRAREHVYSAPFCSTALITLLLHRMILSRETAARKLNRLAMEVAERNLGNEELILIGIRENGIHIARAIAKHLGAVFTGRIKVIELWLDKKHPREIRLSEETDFSGKHILLVDDVANSGRTMLYSLKPLLDHYPARVETLALLERTYKQYPIAVDYVGLSVSTAPEEHIIVEVEHGEVTGARVV